MRPVRIAVSILTADFARLGEQIREAEAAGADVVHLDVMDGYFVPTISFGPLVVKGVRNVTSLPLEVHLMVERPERQIGEFIAAGAETLIVHVESTKHIHGVVQEIQRKGAKAGVTLNPGTNLSALDEVLAGADQVQLMAVNPGRGGQPFIPRTIERLRTMRAALEKLGLDVALEVDGGVNETSATAVVRAGADLLVAGSAVFNDRESVTAALGRLRRAVGLAQKELVGARDFEPIFVKQQAIWTALCGGMYRIGEIRVRALAATLDDRGSSLWASSGPCPTPAYLNGKSIRWHVQKGYSKGTVYVQQMGGGTKVPVDSDKSKPWKPKTFSHLWGAPDHLDPLPHERVEAARRILRALETDYERIEGET